MIWVKNFIPLYISTKALPRMQQVCKSRDNSYFLLLFKNLQKVVYHFRKLYSFAILLWCSGNSNTLPCRYICSTLVQIMLWVNTNNWPFYYTCTQALRYWNTHNLIINYFPFILPSYFSKILCWFFKENNMYLDTLYLNFISR